MNLLGSGNRTALGPRASTTIVAPPPRRKGGIGWILFIFVAFGGWLLWGALNAPSPSASPTTATDRNPIAITTPEISDYVLLQESRVDTAAELDALRADRAALDTQIQAMSNEWLQATAERQAEILLESQRLDNRRKELGILIEEEEAAIRNKASELAMVNEARATEMAVYAVATRAAVQATEAEAQAISNKSQAWGVAIVQVALAATVALFAVCLGLVTLPYGLRFARQVLANAARDAAVKDDVFSHATAGRVQPPPPTGYPIRDPHWNSENNRNSQRGSTGSTIGNSAGSSRDTGRNTDHVVMVEVAPCLYDFLSDDQVEQLPIGSDRPAWAIDAARRMLQEGMSKRDISAGLRISGRAYRRFFNEVER